eukprot:14247262-Ditylum_brightwellii.AAC.1
MGAWESALDLYAYGQNVIVGDSLNSLKDFVILKIDTLHLGVNFQDFTGNFDGIEEYINAALAGDNMFIDASNDQCTKGVRRMLQGLVIYLYALGELQNASNNCGADPLSNSLSSCDIGAAYLMGLIKANTYEYNSNCFGQTLFALANEMCIYFGTYVSSVKAHVSDSLVDYLNTVGEKDIN